MFTVGERVVIIDNGNARAFHTPNIGSIATIVREATLEEKRREYGVNLYPLNDTSYWVLLVEQHWRGDPLPEEINSVIFHESELSLNGVGYMLRTLGENK
jgi:hypothetical protein